MIWLGNGSHLDASETTARRVRVGTRGAYGLEGDSEARNRSYTLLLHREVIYRSSPWTGAAGHSTKIYVYTVLILTGERGAATCSSTTCSGIPLAVVPLAVVPLAVVPLAVVPLAVVPLAVIYHLQ